MLSDISIKELLFLQIGQQGNTFIKDEAEIKCDTKETISEKKTSENFPQLFLFWKSISKNPEAVTHGWLE